MRETPPVPKAMTEVVQLVRADRAAAPGPAGPAGLGVAARADRRRLRRGERPGQRVWPPVASWPALLAVEVSFMLLWYALLLRLVGRRERFLQTATAVFGFQLLLAPLLVACSGWCGASSTTWCGRCRLRWPASRSWSGWSRPTATWCSAALEWSSGASVALVIVQIARRTAAAVRPVPARRAEAVVRMHVHILGICGTFMGGIAAIAARRRLPRHRLGPQRLPAHEHPAGGARASS